MRIFKKIIKTTLLYGVFYLIEKISLSVFFLLYLKSELPFVEILLKIISGNINLLIEHDWILTVAYLFCDLLELIVFYVFTSYIFMYIINRESRVFLPPKLLIRYRTSEGVNDKLTLGIMAENRNKFNIYNVKCIIMFRYVKSEDPLLFNSESILESTHPIIENFYRFSFALNDFPVKVLKDFLDKSEIAAKEDIFTVLLTGNTDFDGHTFGVSRRYYLSDIMIAEHNVKDLKKKNIFKQYKMNWGKLETPIEISENKRNGVIDEISKIVNKS